MEKQGTVIIVGSVFDGDSGNIRNKYWKNSDISIANAIYEEKILDGIRRRTDWEHFYISTPPVGIYPKTCKRGSFSEKAASQDIFYTSFSTKFGISHWSKSRAIWKVLKAILSSVDMSKRVIIIACEAFQPYLKAIDQAKKKYPGIETCLIVPDLPATMSPKKNFIMRIAKKHYIKVTDKLAKKFDKFIYFNREMVGYYEDTRPSLVSNGLIPNILPLETKKVKKRMVFVGRLSKGNGLSILLDAFSLLNGPGYELCIAGGGALLDDVLAAEQRDSRIKYCGFLSHEETLNLEASASLLCCLRVPSKAATNAFPSKLVEMLRFPTPIVAFDGDYLNEMVRPLLEISKSMSSKDVAECIESAISIQEIDFDRRIPFLKTLLFEDMFKWIVEN